MPRHGWPDLAPKPAHQERPATYRQLDVRPGFEQSGGGREDNTIPPDASIKERAPVNYERGGPGELQPLPLEGLDFLFGPGSKP